MARSFDKYAFYAFYLAAVVLYVLQPKDPQAIQNPVDIYLVLAGVVLGLTLLAPQPVVEFARLKPSTITLRFIVVILPIMILSNSFLLWGQKILGDVQFVLRPFSLTYWINRCFFGGVRIFMEELIFRGLLLLPWVSKNVQVFWLANIAQSACFATLHAFVPVHPNFRLPFIIYAFILSIAFGWLNRKFNSLMPSWVIHCTNGVLSSWIFMNISGAL